MSRTLLSCVAAVILASLLADGHALALRHGSGVARTSVNHSGSANRNTSVNAIRNVNIDRDIDIDGDHARPPLCTAITVSGVSYQQCGSTWYMPQFSGSTVNYVVVNPPR